MTKAPPRPLGSVLAYGAGGTASGLISTVPSILLLYFCTNVLGLDPASSTAIVFIPKAAALILDPLAGCFFDRAGATPAKRRTLLLASGVVMTIGFLLVFMPPLWTRWPTIVWMLASYAILAVGYSFFHVGHLSLPAIAACGREERGRWMSWRMTLVLAGVLVGAGLAPLVVTAAGGGRAGYAAMAGAGAVVLLAGILASSLFAGRAASVTASRPCVTPTSFIAPLKIRSLRALARAYLLILCGAGLMSAAFPYWMVALEGRAVGDVGAAMGLLLITAMLSAPLWSLLGRRIGENHALAIATGGYAGSTLMLTALFAFDVDWLLVLAGFGLTGFAFGGAQVLPFTILSHLAAASGRSGQAREGAVTGVFTATEKLGLALGPALTGTVLWGFGGLVTPASAWATGALASALIAAGAASTLTIEVDR